MKSILYLTIVTITVLLQTCTIQATQLSKPSVTLRTNKDINNKDYYYKEQSVTNLSSYEIQKSCDNTQVIAQADAATTTVAPSKLAQTLKLTGLFVLWYAFNAGYNVFNSKVKDQFQFPLTSAAAQLLIGLFYSVPLWFIGIRKLPRITGEDLMRLLPIAFLNAGGHVATVIATFEKGGGSFTHVIKASEPVVSVLLAFIVNGIIPKPLTGLSLLPVCYGVAYASTLGNLNPQTMGKELTTKAAKMAMFSNFAFSMRSIMRKNLPSNFKEKTNLDSANEFAVTTILSVMMVLPLALSFESVPTMANTVSSIVNKPAFSMKLILCGLSFYLYNEMQNIVLGSLGPVPTAVGNTLKRVVIFVALYLFTAGETFPLPKVIGCAIAIAGCLLFAIFDSKKM